MKKQAPGAAYTTRGIGSDALPGGRGARHGEGAWAPEAVSDDDLARILAILRASHSVDFTPYRMSTIRRRVQRRRALARADSVAAYIDLLEARPPEVEALYQDILIKVTHFFRDPEVFAALAGEVFPTLLQAHRGDAPIRIWVPGCATGEEVYSLAITLLETMEGHLREVPFQIFATDISEQALTRGRAGLYPESIAAAVSPLRLQRYFTRTGGHYQVSRSVRDACVFARQNVTRDPPFSKLDLISCRNLLIYFGTPLQKRVIPTLHYALRSTGFLVLGASETVSGLADYFTLVDKKNNIYRKNMTSGRARPDGQARSPASSVSTTSAASAESADLTGSPESPVPKPLLLALAAEGSPQPFDLQAEADRAVLRRYAPPGVVINAELQIVQFRGQTGPYIDPPPGEASLNVLRMARTGLVGELRAALHKAKRSGAPVRAERVPLREGGTRREIAIEVIPLAVGRDPWFVVLFEETGPVSRVAAGGGAGGGGKKGKGDAPVAELTRELSAAKEYLQLTIEEHQATHDALQAANEELLSSNEELQSINEELETAKEELQSANEALTMLNDELDGRNAELGRANSDLVNLLGSVNIPMMMLDAEGRIRRFTPQATRVLNVIPGDVGRPIGDIKPKIDAPDLEQLIAEVVETMAIREREVQDRDGRWYLMRIRPYRAADGKIDGAVIVLVDVDRLKRSAPAGGEG